MADLTNIPGFHYDPLKRDTLLDEQDPFLGSETQTHRMRAYCDIWVAGVNITDKLEPHLISVRVKDAGVTECEIEIDDRDAKLPLPPLQAAIEVYLGWSREELRNVFQGVISDFEHGFGRKQGGRRMWVRATGFDFLGTKIKEPMSNILGEGAPPARRKASCTGCRSGWKRSLKLGAARP